jgi:chemotaxis protein MotB
MILGRAGVVLSLLFLCLGGCSQNGNFAKAFSFSSRGAAGRVPSGTPAQQVAQLEQWRRESENEVTQMRTRVADLTERNQSLQTQVANVKRHTQLQDQHLKSVSDRLAATTTELAQTQVQRKDTSQNAASLNQLNQEKERQLAAARQSVQRLEDELRQSRDRLQSVRDRLARSESENVAAQKSVEHLSAASRQRGGATISANRNLPLVDIPTDAATIERDGDVIRVRLTSERIFKPNTAQLRDNVSGPLDQIAKKLAHAYPNQRIGVEGHASSTASGVGVWRNGHHLSSAQAMAVYEFFMSQSLFRTDQMFIVGHGSNHPVYSTATTSGRRANDRVEIVIYPDTVGGGSR